MDDKRMIHQYLIVEKNMLKTITCNRDAAATSQYVHCAFTYDISSIN